MCETATEWGNVSEGYMWKKQRGYRINLKLVCSSPETSETYCTLHDSEWQMVSSRGRCTHSVLTPGWSEPPDLESGI